MEKIPDEKIDRFWQICCPFKAMTLEGTHGMSWLTVFWQTAIEINFWQVFSLLGCYHTFFIATVVYFDMEGVT